MDDPEAEEEITDGYCVSNLRLSKTFNSHVEAYVAVNNIFDKCYESERWYPSPGRNFFVGIALRY